MTEHMTAEEYRRANAVSMTEAQLQEEVRVLCDTARTTADPTLLYYHTHRSQHSPAGFPDVIIGSTRHGLVIAAELKREAKRYKPTDAQVEWLDMYEECGVPAFLWRPRHLLSGEIHEIIMAAANGRDPGAMARDSKWRSV